MNEAASPAIARSADRREAVRTAQELTGGMSRTAGRRCTISARLEGLRERVYIAGVLPNTPENLVWWIQHPQTVDPKTAMPETGIGPVDAHHVAAYLYSLD